MKKARRSTWNADDAVAAIVAYRAAIGQPVTEPQARDALRDAALPALTNSPSAG